MPLLLLHLCNPNNIPQNIQPLLPVPRLLIIPFQMKRLGKVQRFLTSFTDLDAGEIKKVNLVDDDHHFLKEYSRWFL